jgi:acyl-CoA thioester hydrolase
LPANWTLEALGCEMENRSFEIELEVRDYECDLQGIVNHAVYLHYLEHARHRMLKANGLDFAGLARDGVNLVVTRIELEYLQPLRSGDRFRVSLTLERVSRLRFAFRQAIFRIPDGREIVRARVIGTALDAAGRPRLPLEVDQLLGKSIAPPPEA